jgi:hypothetical protein
MNTADFISAIDTLRAGMHHLNTSDQNFAASLLSQLDKRGLSSKQEFWVGKLAAKITNPAVDNSRVKTKIGDLAGINALFDAARSHLKRPAIVLAAPIEHHNGKGFIGEFDLLRLSVAGSNARVPDSINVTDGGDTWFGRILSSGDFEASPRVKTPQHVVPALARFAAEPARVAKESAMLTGKCCFCNKTLTDERSTSVGYGPICAGHFNLPWGE